MMKQLIELENWIDNVIQEQNKFDRPLPRGQDIQYQASRMYPDRSPEQALQLFVANKLETSEKMDFEQNKLINAQKRENEKLRRSLTDLSSELTDHEQQAQVTDKEVARLKDLSSKLKPAGEIQQQVAKASSEKVEAMLADLEKVKSNPNVSDKQYKDLETRINQVKNSPVVSNKDIDGLRAKLQQLETEKGNIQQNLVSTTKFALNTKQQLDAKEKRFAKYVGQTVPKRIQSAIEKEAEKHSEEMAKYSKIVDSYKDQINGLQNQVKNVRDEVEDDLRFIKMLVPRLKSQFPQVSKQDIDLTGTARPQAANMPVKDIPTDIRKSLSKELLDIDDAKPSMKIAEDINKNEYIEWVRANGKKTMRYLQKEFLDVIDNYPTQQVADTILDNIWLIYDEQNPISEQRIKEFALYIIAQLKKQQPEPKQYDLPLSYNNNIVEAYENELDKIIGLPEIFK